MSIIEWLRLPQTRDMDGLDDSAAIQLHSRIIERKPFLRRLYSDFYRTWVYAVGDLEGKNLVEIGSGGGFAREIIPNLVTSDIIQVPNTDMTFSATDMPFEDGSIDAFFMLNVLHHLAEPHLFFEEASRCLKPAGKVVMIEPSNTPWSRFIHINFHHEDFDPQAAWESPGRCAMFHGNGALPWIIFTRNRNQFEMRFPLLRIVDINLHTPLSYLISGGLSIRALLPPSCYRLVRATERLLAPCNKWLAMFQTIVLEHA